MCDDDCDKVKMEQNCRLEFNKTAMRICRWASVVSNRCGLTCETRIQHMRLISNSKMCEVQNAQTRQEGLYERLHQSDKT